MRLKIEENCFLNGQTNLILTNLGHFKLNFEYFFILIYTKHILNILNLYIKNSRYLQYISRRTKRKLSMKYLWRTRPICNIRSVGLILKDLVCICFLFLFLIGIIWNGYMEPISGTGYDPAPEPHHSVSNRGLCALKQLDLFI